MLAFDLHKWEKLVLCSRQSKLWPFRTRRSPRFCAVVRGTSSPWSSWDSIRGRLHHRESADRTVQYTDRHLSKTTVFANTDLFHWDWPSDVNWVKPDNKIYIMSWQRTSAVMLMYMGHKHVLVVGRQGLQPVVINYLWQLLRRLKFSAMFLCPFRLTSR